MRNRKIFLAAAFIIVAAIIVFYSAVDPSTSRWAPKCLFHTLTGWDCPGCGAQRALHALLHGRFAEAWSYNPFIFIIIPLAAVLGVIEAMRGRMPGLYKAIYRPSTFVAVLIIITGWTVARNILNI